MPNESVKRPEDRVENISSSPAEAEDLVGVSGQEDGIRPLRRDEVDAYGVRDELVLHDRRQGRVYALNVSARLTWERCDGRATLAEISASLSRDLDHDPDEVRAGVVAVFTQLRRRGLLALDGRGEERALPESEDPSSTVRIGFRGRQVVVRTDTPAVADWISHLFRALCTEEPGSVVGRLCVRRQDDRYTIDGTRDVHVHAGSLAEALHGLKYEIVLQLIEAQPDLVWLHAGAAADPQGAVIIAGDWGCGKSTLVTALHRRGWLYLSDDVLPYDPVSRRLLPFPLTPMARDARHRWLSPDRLAATSKKWIDLDPGGVCTAPVPVSALVFPTYEPDTAAKLEPCSPGTAVVELVQQGLNAESLQGNAIQPLCDLVDRVPAYRLVYSRGEQAAHAIIHAVKS